MILDIFLYRCNLYWRFTITGERRMSGFIYLWWNLEVKLIYADISTRIAFKEWTNWFWKIFSCIQISNNMVYRSQFVSLWIIIPMQMWKTLSHKAIMKDRWCRRWNSTVWFNVSCIMFTVFFPVWFHGDGIKWYFSTIRFWPISTSSVRSKSTKERMVR